MAIDWDHAHATVNPAARVMTKRVFLAPYEPGLRLFEPGLRHDFGNPESHSSGPYLPGEPNRNHLATLVAEISHLED